MIWGHLGIHKAHFIAFSPQNTSMYCRQIIVVHVHANAYFLKFTQRLKMLQTVSNQEVTLKRLISMLGIAQELYVGA